MNPIAWPILLPLLSGTLLLLLRGRRARTALAVTASSLTLLTSLAIAWRAFGGEVLVLQMGGWPAPFGISLVADRLTALMLTLSSGVGLLTVLFAASSLQHAPNHGQGTLLNRAREAFGYLALLQFLFMGVHMSFLTGDLFNLFVAFEVMLISSYGLMLIGGELPQLREGFKYVVINLVASAVFVMAAGLAYGLFGTLNMADIARVVAEAGAPGGVADARVAMVALLLALVFATKAALFPFGFWLPNAYPVPTAAASAFFASVLTKVGAYALIRTFTLMFPEVGLPQQLILALAGVTMLIGGFGAIARQRWRHALAFANVASIGYLLFGAFLATDAGLSAAIYYLAHSVLAMFALFLLAALAERVSGTSYRAHGHLDRYPWLGVGYFVGVMALAGMPPTSGFIGKFALLQALLADGGPLRLAVTVAAVVAGFLLLYAGMQVWRFFFWGSSDAVHRVHIPTPMRWVTGASVALLLLLALASGPAYRLAVDTAEQLRHDDAYIRAVLEEHGVPAGFGAKDDHGEASESAPHGPEEAPAAGEEAHP